MSRERETTKVQPICVYDADCSICTKLACWASKRSPVTFTGYADLRDRGVDPVAYSEYLVFAGETVQRGHHAVAAVLKTMGVPWSWLGSIIDWRIVSPLAGATYKQVAKRRPCATGGTCAVTR
ncbi:thiol-disulfide oxidoreductase DCC family protein [Flaviflexus sp.]|uniref:thiol-disulfide oxidoreductase DCC family protein n=1 Tax=Flaviflexus sp. TaxID=1969482 RepID=UPI00352D8BEE